MTIKKTKTLKLVEFRQISCIFHTNYTELMGYSHDTNASPVAQGL